jgi:hypothetical protein
MLGIMRRRLILLAVAALPVALTAVAHGCSSEPPFESVCDWMNDPNNCYREFHQDLLAVSSPTNPDNPNGDCRTYDPSGPVSQIPTEASEAAPGTPNGTFAMRAMLDTCTLNEGGQVKFNPAIDLTMYPPPLLAPPITYAISLVNPDGNECGNLTYTSPHGFSITIDPPPDAGSTAMGDASVGDGAVVALSDAGVFDDPDGESPVTNGTYTQVIAPGRDAFDVTCPTGESHHFNLDEVDGIGVTTADGGSTSQCPALINVVPSASLQIFLGGTDTPGAVSLAITWPPDPTSTTAYVPDNNFAGAPLVANSPTVYFNCTIPAAAETCADGVKDGFETDTDCGGPQGPTEQPCGSCPVRCEVNQQCLCDADCDEASGLFCIVAAGTGMRQCVVPDGGVDANIHFPTCSWSADAGTKCASSGTTGAGGGGTGGSGTGGSGTGGSGTGGAPTDAGAG